MWSPDGTRIAYRRGRDTWTIDMETLADELLVKRVSSFVWSPDGQYIAYVALSSIYIADADGSNAYPIAASANSLSWSPNGQFLILTRYNGSAENIYRIESDGSDLTLLMEAGDFVRNIIWER